MAITETGAIYKALSFDGESSRTYGVYITGEAVYNAPERDIEMISIPGRNGAYSLDKGRFQNIEVTYPAGIFADNETDFRNAISDFRNFLCSKRGYVRLTDEYNPNEYRMAVYKSGLEVTPAMLKAGEFNIVFDAKPQRWLTDGENKITMGTSWSDLHTETDSIVEIDNGSGVVGIKDIDIAIEAVQSGSGTPSPDNVRPISGWSNAHVYVGAVSGTADTTYTIGLDGTRYGGTLDVTTGTLTVTHDIVDLGTLNWSYTGAGTANSRFECNLPSQTIGSGGSTVPTNILCSGYEIAAFDAIYAHHKDKVIGLWSASVGAPTSVIVAYDSAYTDAATFKTAMNGVQLVYELATPTTVSLTAEDIELLTGTNYVWADTGDSTIEYGQSPGLITNPTLFDASPMLEVEGYGTIDCNGYEIEIENEILGNVLLVDFPAAIGVKSTTLSAVYSISFDPNYVENGDTIAFNSKYYVLNGTRTYYSGDINAYFRLNENATKGTTQISGTNTVRALFPYRSSDPTSWSIALYTNPASFTVGTASTFTASGTAILPITYNGSTGSSQLSSTFTLAYDGDTTFTITITRAIDSDPLGVWSIDSRGFQIQMSDGYAESTKSILGQPTYIDCDLGVVYKIENDSVIDLNSYVDLGSDLPVLSPGSNTITYDNTVTDLKVVPRWWKV